MFTPKRKQERTVLKISDSHITSLTLKKNDHGFFVDSHDIFEIPEGIIVRGEILKADVFYNLCKKIAKNIGSVSVDVLLPHEYFLFSNALLENRTRGKSNKKRIQYYFNQQEEKESWQKTHICEFSIYPQQSGKDKALFTCLPKDIHTSYIHILKKAGINIVSLGSDILAFDHLLGKGRRTLIVVEEDATRVVDFKDGVFNNSKTFAVSYRQFVDDISEVLGIDNEKARSILNRFGILRSHKEERVFKKMRRSLSPLLEFLSKRGIEQGSAPNGSEIEPVTYITFNNIPIEGFVDECKKRINHNTQELYVIKNTAYQFQDILTLHHLESYQYQSLIAQALKFWKS